MESPILLSGIVGLGEIKNMEIIKLKDKCGVRGKLRFIVYKAGTKKILRVSDWNENLVVLNAGHGMNLLALRLIDDTTYDLVITQAKIGDDNTAATDDDTDLGNSILDGILVATAAETGTSQITLEFFMADAELNEDDYEEFGIFCGDQLFARSVISPAHTKSIGEDTKVEYVINFNNT